MVLVCMVTNCRNSKSTTKKENCDLFRVPKDLSRSKEWLINCGRKDLLSKSVDNLYNNYSVYEPFKKKNMFSNTEKSRLMISAVPTEFVMQTVTSTSSDVSTIVDPPLDLSSPSTSMLLSISILDKLVEIKPNSSASSTQTTKS